MGEGGRGRWVGQVVGGHVDRLHRGDRALLGGGDALLQRAHVGGQRRLIAHGGRDAPEQGRHFGAGLGEAEDVVDEEQHVLAFFVAEVLGQRQAGQRDAGAGTRRLVHLAINQRHLGALGRALAQLDHAGIDHLVVQVVAFAGPLADAGKDGHAAMAFGDVVDQFLNQHRLAHAGAAEQADLAALQIRAEQVHHLDAGHQDLGRGRLILERGGGTVDRVGHLRVDRAALVDRLADHVQDAAERLWTDGNADRRAGVQHLAAANQAVGAVHGDAAHRSLTQFLRHFHHQRAGRGLGGQRVLDRRAGRRSNSTSSDGADDLADTTYVVVRHRVMGL